MNSTTCWRSNERSLTRKNLNAIIQQKRGDEFDAPEALMRDLRMGRKAEYGSTYVPDAIMARTFSGGLPLGADTERIEMSQTFRSPSMPSLSTSKFASLLSQPPSSVADISAPKVTTSPTLEISSKIEASRRARAVDWSSMVGFKPTQNRNQNEESSSWTNATLPQMEPDALMNRSDSRMQGMGPASAKDFSKHGHWAKPVPSRTWQSGERGGQRFSFNQLVASTDSQGPRVDMTIIARNGVSHWVPAGPQGFRTS